MKTWIIFVLLVVATPLQACIAKTLPDLNKLEQYTQIYIAQVTGVVLTDYQKLRKESIENGKDQYWFSDITLNHQVNAILSKSIKGKTEILTVHNITGCAIGIPSTGMYGLFFVNKFGKVIPIYENEGKLYYDYLIKVSG